MMRKVKVTWEGRSQMFSWPPDCLLAVAASDASMVLGVQLYPGGRPIFYDSFGNPLDAEKTLEEEGVMNEEPLELAVR